MSGRFTIWMIALAVGAGGDGLDIFTLFYLFSFFFVVRHYKTKFDLDPGSIFRLLLQFRFRKLNTM